MTDGARELAKQFKAFLQSREEDDLIPAAFSKAADSSVFSPQKAAAPQDHLTIEFTRKAHGPAQAAAPQQQAAEHAEPNAELNASQAYKSSAQSSADNTPSIHSATTEAPMTPQEKQAALDQIAQEIKACHRCPLGDTRLNAVPGEGNPAAELMFIGEGPGFDEDHKGRPFIGRAGQLLDKMIAAMGLTREQVFIGNIAKCHPMVNPANPEAHGNDRAPNQGEIAVCRKYIERQIAAISPKYVVALGGVAAKALISDTKSLGALRGRFHLLHLDSVELKTPVKILATYHPAALLRNPGWKKDAWADLQMVMAEMGLKRPQA